MVRLASFMLKLWKRWNMSCMVMWSSKYHYFDGIGQICYLIF